MTRSFFGTDGIRGKANAGNVTPAQMLRLGQAISAALKSETDCPSILIGRDTRHSGLMIEQALTSGLLSGGANVTLAGIVPTPAIGTQTKALGFNAGVMITASHNPYTDNGVKLFGPDGYKASDNVQQTINDMMDGDETRLLVAAEDIGRLSQSSQIIEGYLASVRSSLPKQFSLQGKRIGVDAANGAGFDILPKLLQAYGADIVRLGCAPDGFNINHDCGSEHPDVLVRTVLREGCEVGIGLDGDADRIVMVDKGGELVDGDQILALLTEVMCDVGSLTGGAVVATVMSNLGLERFVKSKGLDFIRTKVGDRHVVAEMRERGANLGGEQSGHIILRDHSTTGDGIMTAMHVLAALFGTEKPRSLGVFTPIPQILVNVRFRSDDPLSDPNVKKAVAAVESELGGAGRLVIRKSGTEPLVRVMVEVERESDAKRLAHMLAGHVERAP